MKSIIRNFIAKMVAGRSDDGIMITLKDPKKVEFQAAMMEDFLMRNGIDPRAIQSEEQLKMILNQINNINQPTSGVRGTESAKVFNRMGEELDPNQPIIGGTQPGKSIDTDTFSRLAETNTQRMKQKIADKKIDTDVDTIVKNIKSMEPMTAMKEANSVIGRKGKYKNLTPEQSKKILKDTEDHIFERDVKPSEFDPDIEDKADGGRIGLKGGADASQFDKSPSEQRSVDISPGGGVTLGSGPPEGPDDRGNNDNRPPPVKKTIPPEIKKAVNLGGDISYLKNLIELNPVGIIKNIGGKILFDKITGDQTSLDTEDDDMKVAELSQKQLDFLNSPKTQRDLKDKFLSPQQVFDKLPSYEEKPFFGTNQEPTTPEEFNQYLDTIDKNKYLERLTVADGGRIGFFMGSNFPKGLAALRQMAQYFGKKSDAVKNPSDILKIVNPKRLNQLLENPEIYRKFDVKKGIAAPDLIKDLQKQMMADRQKTIEEMLGAAKNIKRADDNVLKNKNDMIKDMMSKGVDRNMAEEMANTISKMAEGAAGKIDTPKLTDEGILELENILKNMETGGKKKRDLNADGGRIGYKDGPGMNRRTFLKLLGGFLSIPIIGKIVKPLKTVKGVKNVPVIKTDNVPGKPEWFDQLVNKVIIEGDDVTKRFATQEREIVHTKKINNTDEVTVYQDLNTDSVRVEYNSPKNMLEEPVDLSYKRTPPDEGAPRGSAEFEVTESGFVGRADGPDDYFIDAEPVGGSRIKDLDSDVSALKEYATGKGPTMKEFVQKKKRIDKVKKINEGDLDERSQYITDRQGDYDPGPEEFASGGIAGMLGE